MHFAFGTLTEEYQVQLGDVMSKYEFENFKRLKGPKRILSFGGWEFSTNESTYSIFRQGVKDANRVTLAENIAKVITDNGLDGVDIDWEYPGVSKRQAPLLLRVLTRSISRPLTFQTSHPPIKTTARTI